MRRTCWSAHDDAARGALHLNVTVELENKLYVTSRMDGAVATQGRAAISLPGHSSPCLYYRRTSNIKGLHKQSKRPGPRGRMCACGMRGAKTPKRHCAPCAARPGRRPARAGASTCRCRAHPACHVRAHPCEMPVRFTKFDSRVPAPGLMRHVPWPSHAGAALVDPTSCSGDVASGMHKNLRRTQSTVNACAGP